MVQTQCHSYLKGKKLLLKVKIIHIITQPLPKKDRNNFVRSLCWAIRLIACNTTPSMLLNKYTPGAGPVKLSLTVIYTTDE